MSLPGFDDFRGGRARAGFTLIELVAALAIAAIFFFIFGGADKLTLFSERIKADSARETAIEVATANNAYRLDRGRFASGKIGNGHPLVRTRLLSMRNWASLPYDYYAVAFSTPSAGFAAVAARKTSAPAGTKTPPYSEWGFCVGRDLVVTSAPGVDACRVFLGNGLSSPAVSGGSGGEAAVSLSTQTEIVPPAEEPAEIYGVFRNP